MVTTALIIFAVAAVFGLVLLTYILKNTTTNKLVVVLHGLFAATGLVLLIIYVINNTSTSPIASLVLFIIAALGGFILVARDFSSKPGPKALAVIHAAAAVIGFLLLLVFVIGM